MQDMQEGLEMIDNQPKPMLPEINEESKPLPDAKRKKKALPKEKTEVKPLPPIEHMENVIMIGGDPIEIKPTKLKYQRDRTAAFYRILEIYPLPDVLAMDRGVLDPERDGDKCLFDFCIAVTDSPEYIKKHYDEMDAEVIEQMIEIFKRLNKITDKEEQVKNRMAKETQR